MFAAEAGDFFLVPSVEGGDLDSGDSLSGAGVGFRNVAAADEADVESHEEFSVVRFESQGRRKNSWDLCFFQMIRRVCGC